MLKHNRTVAAMRHRSKSDGFTLVELLVVIVILGILAGVVVFAVSGINDRSRTNACKSEGRTVRTAVEAYKAEHTNNAAPNSVGDLTGAGFLESTPTYWTVGAGGAVSRTSADADDCP